MMRRRRAGALQLGGALLLAAAVAADANGAEDASGQGSTNHYEVIGTQVAVPLEGLEAAVYEKERSDKHEDIRDAVSGGAQVEWASTAAAAEDDVESTGGVGAKGVATTSENGQDGSEGGDVLEETACRWLGFVHIPKTGGTSVMQAITQVASGALQSSVLRALKPCRRGRTAFACQAAAGGEGLLRAHGVMG